MNWKKTFGSYKTRRFIAKEVGGATVHFFPNRVGVLEEAAELTEPITRAVALAMGAGDARDVETHTKTQSNDDFMINEVNVKPSDLKVLKAKQEHREEVIADLLKIFTSRPRLIRLARIWMDSMSELFPRHRDVPSLAEAEEFLFGDGEEYAGLEIPQMVDIVSGWLQANSKAFGEMGEKMVALVKEQMEPSATNGESSNTPSSPPLATVSDSPTSSD